MDQDPAAQAGADRDAMDRRLRGVIEHLVAVILTFQKAQGELNSALALADATGLPRDPIQSIARDVQALDEATYDQLLGLIGRLAEIEAGSQN